MALFHADYGQHQYHPLVVSEATTRHVFVASLRHGTAHVSLGADGDLMAVVAALGAARPGVAVDARGDAGFSLPLMCGVCEANGLTYTLGFSSNARLKWMTEGSMGRALEQHGRTGENARLSEGFQYKCDSWDAARTVVAPFDSAQGPSATPAGPTCGLWSRTSPASPPPPTANGCTTATASAARASTGWTS